MHTAEQVAEMTRPGGRRLVPMVDLAAQQEEIADEVEAGLEGGLRPGGVRRRPRRGGVRAGLRPVRRRRELRRGRQRHGRPGTGAACVRGHGGGEVVLPANTFIATAEAVSRIGAVPVLVDVDPEHLLIDPTGWSSGDTPTQAIIPVHCSAKQRR